MINASTSHYLHLVPRPQHCRTRTTQSAARAAIASSRSAAQKTSSIANAWPDSSELDGYEMVLEPEGSDFVVINTCGFIADSRAESHATIREMLDLKKQGKTAA